MSGATMLDAGVEDTTETDREQYTHKNHSL